MHKLQKYIFLKGNYSNISFLGKTNDNIGNKSIFMNNTNSASNKNFIFAN